MAREELTKLYLVAHDTLNDPRNTVRLGVRPLRDKHLAEQAASVRYGRILKPARSEKPTGVPWEFTHLWVTANAYGVRFMHDKIGVVCAGSWAEIMPAHEIVEPTLFTVVRGTHYEGRQPGHTLELQVSEQNRIIAATPIAIPHVAQATMVVRNGFMVKPSKTDYVSVLLFTAKGEVGVYSVSSEFRE